MKLLHQKDMLDLDQTYHSCRQRSHQFWREVLTEILHINEEIAEVLSAHSENMISEAILRHYRVFGMKRDFATIVARF